MDDHDEQFLDPTYRACIRASLIYACFPAGHEDDVDPATGVKLRLDAYEYLYEAREDFFALASARGLNVHQALHSWNDSLDREFVNGLELTVRGFCEPRLAEGLGVTVEELRKTHPFLIQAALDTGRPLAEVKAEVERQSKALEN